MTVSSNRIYEFLQKIKKKGFCPKNLEMNCGFAVYNKKGGYKILGFSFIDNGKVIYKDTKGNVVARSNFLKKSEKEIQKELNNYKTKV